MGVLAGVAGFIGAYGGAILSVVSVAASIAMLFVPRGASTEGPRLNDSTVTTSTYGIAIPRIIGRVRIAGNMIWSTDIEEVRRRRSVGKGGLFSGPKQTTYSYYGNFAMAFGTGDGGGCFAKIFADRKLMYDATGGSKAFLKYKEAALRFYVGGDDQEADPLIEADLGAGNVSAHKDLTYIVFENLPLHDFGNRIPHMEAVFDSSAEASYSKDLTTGSNLPAEVLQDARYDSTTRQFYVVDAPTPFVGSIASIWRMDMDSNAEGAYIFAPPVGTGPPYLFPEHFIPNGFKVGGVFPHTDGKLFVTGETEDGDAVVRINQYTLGFMSATEYGDVPDANGNFKDMASISITRDHVTRRNNYLLLAHDPAEGPPDVEAKVYIYDRDEHFISGPQLHIGDESYATGTRLRASCSDRDGIVWMLATDPTSTPGPGGNRQQLLKITINRTINLKLYGIPLAKSGAKPKMEIIDLTYTGLNDSRAIAYDRSSHSLVIGGTVDSNNVHKWIRWDIHTRSVVVEREFDDDVPAEQGYVISGFNTQSWQTVGVVGGELMASCGGAVQAVRRIRTLDLTDKEEEPPDNFSIRKRLLWDPTQNQGWFISSGTGASTPQRVQWDRCSDAFVPLEDVITELIELTRELGASDIDVTDAGILSQDLRGLIIGRQMPVRRTLESLIFPYQLDIVESDAVLKFVTRGGDSQATIAENDLGATVSGTPPDKLIIDRSQEAEVPRQMDLRYLDWDREFLEGSQSARRHYSPTQTQYSPEVALINVPVVLVAQEAAQAVETGLYSAWVGRTGYQLSVPLKHIALDPTDVFTIERGDESFLARLIEWRLEDGFVSKISAASEDQETYDSDAAGEESPSPDQSFGPPGATELFIFDIPLLRDVDDTNQMGTGVYVAFGRHQDNWRNAIAERSVDGGLRWDRFSISRDSAPWGFLTAALDPLPLETDNTYPSEIQRLDETSQLTFQVVADSDMIEEITRLELWTNDENALVIGSGATAEVVRFQNRTDNGDGTFTLYNLLRGRRGTEESAVAGHDIGERVVLVDADWVNREGIALSRISQPDFYRATSIGEFVETSAIGSVTVQGNDLRPITVSRPVPDTLYTGAARAPVQITWNRRTRNGGDFDLLDGVGQDVIPIGEVEEEYEVVLLHKTTGEEAVSKTATDDATGVSFDGADHTTAGYSDGDLLDVVIYQISSIVGRGYPRAVSL